MQERTNGECKKWSHFDFDGKTHEFRFFVQTKKLMYVYESIVCYWNKQVESRYFHTCLPRQASSNSVLSHKQFFLVRVLTFNTNDVNSNAFLYWCLKSWLLFLCANCIKMPSRPIPKEHLDSNGVPPFSILQCNLLWFSVTVITSTA